MTLMEVRMCGRFVMFRSLDEYVQELDPQGDLFAKVDKTCWR